MALWLLRSGKHGEQEDSCLENNFVTIGWNRVGNLTKVKSREDIKNKLKEKDQDVKEKSIQNNAGQIFSFINKIQKGDMVALPLKKQSFIAIGEIMGGYEFINNYGPDIRHIRRVKWIKKDIPRTSFDQDMLYSLGAFRTVCQIKRNNIEKRLQALIDGKEYTFHNSDNYENNTPVDLEDLSNFQLEKYVQAKFSGHKMAELLSEILKVKGYIVEVSPPGADGGIDILAAKGALGFESPTLCVQVKSSPGQVGVEIFRALQGSMQTFKAEYGLLLSWGGFKSSVLKESRQSFFNVRLWDSVKLIEEIKKCYDQLPSQIQSEIPLKKYWGLVLNDNEN